MSRRRIALGLVANAYDKLLIAGIQLLMVPVLLWQWGLHLYGCWLVLATVPGFLALADMGFSGAAYARMIGQVARGERAAAVRVLQTACQVLAIGSAVVLPAALAVIWAVPGGWLPTDAALSAEATRITLALLVLYGLTVFQAQLAGSAFASVQLAPLYAFTASHVALLENALLAGAAVAGLGPVGGAAGLLAGRVIGTVAQRLLLWRKAPWLRFGIAQADAAERRVLARSAAGMLAIPLGQALVLQGSVVALSAAAGSAATAAFVAARTLSRIGLQATQLLTHAVMPEFAAAHARGDRQSEAQLLLAVAGAALAAALPFALVIGLGGAWLIALWTGGAIVAPAGLMPAFAASVLASGLWTPMSTLMYSINRQDAFAWAYLLLGIAAVVMTVVLGRTLGATGAALTLAALDVVMLAVIARFARRHWLRGLPTAAVARALVTRGRAAMRR